MVSLTMWTLVIAMTTITNEKQQIYVTGPGDMMNCRNEYRIRISKIDQSKLKRLSAKCCMGAVCEPAG